MAHFGSLKRRRVMNLANEKKYTEKEYAEIFNKKMNKLSADIINILIKNKAQIWQFELVHPQIISHSYNLATKKNHFLSNDKNMYR